MYTVATAEDPTAANLKEWHCAQCHMLVCPCFYRSTELMTELMTGRSIDRKRPCFKFVWSCDAYMPYS